MVFSLPLKFTNAALCTRLVNSTWCMYHRYESGVFSSSCGSDVDHAIQMVGYGTAPKGLFKPEMDYWLVRNSWGQGWGEVRTRHHPLLSFFSQPAVHLPATSNSRLTRRPPPAPLFFVRS